MSTPPVKDREASRNLLGPGDKHSSRKHDAEQAIAIGQEAQSKADPETRADGVYRKHERWCV